MAEVCRVLKPGARFRVAVPDMLHPLYESSHSAGRDLTNRLHRSIWTYESLSIALIRAGFARIDLLHHWDNHGVFHERQIDFRRDGYVKRCPSNDKRNRQGLEFGEIHVTSLIVDAFTATDGRSAALQAAGNGARKVVWN